MDFNIYSEPLFSVSQELVRTQSSSSCTPSSSSTQHNSTLSSTSATQTPPPKAPVESPKEDEAIKGGVVEESESEAEFKLESLMVSAAELKQDYCTTGCKELDKFFKGGIPTFGITEFYGEAGSGKTQMCLQLAITAQLSEDEGGLNSGVFYICTEGHFPSKRLAQMLPYFQERHSGISPTIHDFSNNIFIEHAADIEDLAHCVEVKMPVLVRQIHPKKIRMVILDSVAGIFRHEYDDFVKRATCLRQMAQNLHEHSHEHQAAIVVCNQVTTNLELEMNVAALGAAWKNMVTTRICLSKHEISSNSHTRRMMVSFSPYIPAIEIPFLIAANGVRGNIC